MAGRGGRLGVIGGHSLHASLYEGRGRRLDVEAPDGLTVVTVFDCGPNVVLPRHGVDRFVPAHLVDHHAHLAVLQELGCDRLVGLASVGSLRADWGVGTVVVPDDFVALHVTPTFFDDARGHSVPSFDDEWSAEVVKAWMTATTTPIVQGGVFAQTTGPRFETPAEVRLLAAHADLVGMTIAAECILAGEIGVPYAGLCIVDNLANGLGATRLTEEEFRAGIADNRAQHETDVAALVTALAERSAPDEGGGFR